ncbi:unnamed protein product [Amaranthus hypochondriacus]
MAQELAKRQEIVKYGPYGSKLCENFSMKLEGCERIKEVIIRHGFIVDAIGFVIEKPCGGSFTKMFGGCLGRESRNECLIATLKIHTNLNPCGYGAYGQGRDVSNVCSFASPCPPGGPVVGFVGRHNNYLESLGMLVEKECGCSN